MGTVGWLLVVAVGIALGFSVGRLWPGAAAKITQLQRERDAAREDLRNYRKDVSVHFERTAELFDKVTADYRGLYEHLALSARQLSAIRGESAEAPLAEPEQRRLGEPAAVVVPERSTNEPDEAAAVDDSHEPQAPDEAFEPEKPVERAASDEPVEPVKDDEHDEDRPPKEATG